MAAEKLFMASVTNKETKQLVIIKSEYRTKKAFYNDLRSNGYAVRFISTPEDFDTDVEKYHERIEHYNRIQKHKRQIRRELADNL